MDSSSSNDTASSNSSRSGSPQKSVFNKVTNRTTGEDSLGSSDSLTNSAVSSDGDTVLFSNDEELKETLKTGSQRMDKVSRRGSLLSFLEEKPEKGNITVDRRNEKVKKGDSPCCIFC